MQPLLRPTRIEMASTSTAGSRSSHPLVWFLYRRANGTVAEGWSAAGSDEGNDAQGSAGQPAANPLGVPTHRPCPLAVHGLEAQVTRCVYWGTNRPPLARAFAAGERDRPAWFEAVLRTQSRPDRGLALLLDCLMEGPDQASVSTVSQSDDDPQLPAPHKDNHHRSASVRKASARPGTCPCSSRVLWSGTVPCPRGTASFVSSRLPE